MNYLNPTEIKQHLGTLKRFYDDSGYFDPLIINGFVITIYGGSKAFCIPQTYYDNILHYKRVQLHITEQIKDNQDLIFTVREESISPTRDSRFSGFPWIKYFTYADRTGKPLPSHMGSRVPLDEVCQIIRDTYKISRLKIFF